MHRLKAYLSSRWTGSIQLRHLLVREMLILGTLINATTTVLSLILLGSGASIWIGFGIFFLPLPYNLFIFLSVWRSAGQVGGIWGNFACIVATFWLVAATLL